MGIVYLHLLRKAKEYGVCRSRWPRGLRRGAASAGLLELRFRFSTRTWTSVSCECRVSSGRGLCVVSIPLLEESYRVCVGVCVCVCVCVCR